MRDLVDQPGFVHIPPRERLRRHATNKIHDRLGWRPTVSEYEELCERARLHPGPFAEGAAGPADSREVQLWDELRGHKKVRVIYDRREGAIVTVLRGWESEMRGRQPGRAKWRRC